MSLVSQSSTSVFPPEMGQICTRRKLRLFYWFLLDPLSIICILTVLKLKYFYKGNLQQNPKVNYTKRTTWKSSPQHFLSTTIEHRRITVKVTTTKLHFARPHYVIITFSSPLADNKLNSMPMSTLLLAIVVWSWKELASRLVKNAVYCKGIS